MGGQGDLDGLAYINSLDDLDGLGDLSGAGDLGGLGGLCGLCGLCGLGGLGGLILIFYIVSLPVPIMGTIDTRTSNHIAYPIPY